jgi:hypothetical protein
LLPVYLTDRALLVASLQRALYAEFPTPTHQESSSLNIIHIHTFTVDLQVLQDKIYLQSVSSSYLLSVEFNFLIVYNGKID